MTKPLISMLCLLTGGASAAEEFRTLSETTTPASHIDWMGHDTKLLGESGLHLGTPLPPATLVNEKMKEETLGGVGAVRLISVVPSLDTEVCDRQTHLMSEAKNLNAKVERITISRDLPYAQGRFSEKSKLGNLRYLSDYKAGEFGKKMGLIIERNGLLARAMIVVDGAGVVRYFQIVPVIYALPNVAKAIEAANKLVN